jgi:hypothetical protein
MVNQVELKSVWSRVVERVKLQVSHPSFYKAIELAVPITAEGDTFVIGFAPVNLYMAGHLNVSEHKNAIERVIQEMTGHKYIVQIIEGDTLEDWQLSKDKEERRRQLRDSESQQKKVESAAQKAWEKLLILSGRKYAGMPYRGMPQFRAKYIIEMIGLMSDAIDDLMIHEDGKVDELGERQLSRVIERVAQLVEVPGPTIGLELWRYRAEKNSTNGKS